MSRNRNIIMKVILAVLALAMVLPLLLNLITVAMADKAYVDCDDVTGTYSFTAPTDTHVIHTDDYVYNDDWFADSSFTLSRQLATLSSIACMASDTYFTDALETDPSKGDVNIVSFLKDLGFENVATNAYYTQERLPQEAAVCVGSKSVEYDGESYTLLAVIPCSANYKQEWAGNLTLGEGGLAEGFKNGSNEILRFVKNYVADKNISGKVKIWITGHSRGGALADLTAAILAGGSDYIENIEITPENVYGYVFAAPSVMKKDATQKKDLLSVSASRDGRYENDAPAEAYVYDKADATALISPTDSCFKGIHYSIDPNDMLAMYPPEFWGFRLFGTSFQLSDGQASTKAKMLEYLEQIAPELCYLFDEGGDGDTFQWYTFDPMAGTLAPDTEYTPAADAESYFKARYKGLFDGMTTTAQYVESGYQATLSAIAGIYGMGFPEFGAGLLSDTTTLITGGVLAYLDYAGGRISQEREVTKSEGIVIAVEELLEFISGTEIEHSSFTVDDGIYTLAKFIVQGIQVEKVDGKETITYTSPVSEMLVEMLAGMISFEPATLVPMLEMAVYGTNRNRENPDPDSALSTRQSLYMLLGYFLTDYPDVVAAFADNGTKPFGTLVDAVLGLLTEEGETLAQAADRNLCAAVDNALVAANESGRYEEGSAFYDDYQNYVSTLKNNMAIFREMVMKAMLLQPGKEFSTTDGIRNICTFAAQYNIVPAAHYNPVYVAYMKAQDPAYPHVGHVLQHHAFQDADCENPGNTEYWYCDKCERYFADENATKEIDLADTVIEVKEHQWGAWEVVTDASPEQDGQEIRYCQLIKEHFQTREFRYENLSGTMKWTIGKNKEFSFTFKRTVDDEMTFGRFIKVLVDGEEIGSGNYTAVSGSAVITFSPEYLDSLETGDHTVTVVFTDGSAEAPFSVRGSGLGPFTGDTSNLLLWAVSLAASLLCLLLLQRRYIRRYLNY